MKNLSLSLSHLTMFLAAFLFCSLSPQAADMPLQVLQKSPVGENNAPNPITEITATFNQPMVNLTDAKTMGKFCPFQITPPLEGTCSWRGTNTVAFVPSVPIPNAQHYKVTIPKGTRSQVSGAQLDADVSWEFNTLRLQVNESIPYDQEGWIGLDPLIFIRFNMDVDPAVVQGSVFLSEWVKDGKGNPVTVSARVPTYDELKQARAEYWAPDKKVPQSIVVMEPSQRLKVGQAYYLQLKKGLPSLKGQVGLAADRVIQFSTLNNFSLLEHSEGSDCVESQNLDLTFSNPVKLSDLVGHLGVQSGGVDVDVHSIHEDGRNRAQGRVTYRLSGANFRPNSYTKVTINPGLKDVFGNSLDREESFTFNTGNRCAKLNMTQGFGILESYLGHRLPVTSMNLTDVPMRLAAVPEDKVIPLVKALNWRWFDYDQSYGEEGEGGEDEGDYSEENIAAGRIHGKPVSAALADLLSFSVDRPWQPVTQMNIRSRSYIDLDEALADKGKTGGLVYSEMTNNGRTFRAVDDITPLGITLKTSPDSSSAFITYLKSGSPAMGVPVEVRGSSNKVLWQGATDKSGFADFPGWRQLGITEWKRERPVLWVFAHHKEGTAVLSSAMQGGIDPWRFKINWEENPRAQQYEGTVFTERGVYRPGETVHFKGVVRKLEGGDWALPGKKTVRLQLTDPSGTQALDAPLTLSRLGTFHADFPLPAGARTGEWNLRVGDKKKAEDSDLDLSQSFRVEDYKPAAFEVKAIPDKDLYMAGDTLNTKIEGWYLFGAPMAGAAYETSVNFEPTEFVPPHWDDYGFSAGWWQEGRNEGRNATAGSGKLDEKGTALATAILDGNGFSGDFKAVLEADVTSPDRQKLFAHSSVVVHKSGLYIGLKPATTFTEKGKTWKADVVCVTPQGKAVSGVPLKVQMKLRQWISTEKAGFGGRLQWFSETKDSVEKEWTVTSQDEPLGLSYDPQATGEYYLTVSAKDGQARPTESGVSFYVAGKGNAWWARQDDDLIELVPDKKEYKPGDVARIMVKSPYDACHAMVSVERETILKHWTTDLAGGADFITVPITDKSLPNVYVSVMLVKGRMEPPKYDEEGLDLAKPQAKFGYVNLNVNPGGRRLSVKVKTDQEDYRPGQTVHLNLQAQDEKGEGAPCEMAVFVVDEGVLSLTGFETPNPFETFYGPRNLKVLTSDSRLWVIGQRSFGEKGQERGGGGGAKALAGIDLRSNFVPTAYYNPSVTTDGTGIAQLSFKLPDNLSRFRVMAVAMDEKRFGNGESRLTVSKHLVLRPSLPRFARLGDAFQGGVVVHNDSTREMEVTLDAHPGSNAVQVDPSEKLLRKLTLKPGAAQEVLFHFKALHLGKADFKFRAASGDDTDGLEWALPVEATTHLETVASSGAVTDQAVEQMALPTGAVTELGNVRWTFSSTALSGLESGARFLLEYPYGCLEQRSSKILPIVTGAKMLESFGLGSFADLKKGAQDILDHVTDFQCEGGGYRYWTDGGEDPDPWLTAYALDVFHEAQKAGYQLPPGSTDKARSWMDQYLSTPTRRWAYPYSPWEDLEAQAYIVYADALWGGQPGNYFDKLYDRRDQLPVAGKAYLLKAASLLYPGTDRERTLAQELLNLAKVDSQTMHFEETTKWDDFWWIHETRVDTTAVCLQALLEAQGGFTDDQKAVQWLVRERKGRDDWRTTEENGSVLRALGDYYRRHEKVSPDFTADLSQEGVDAPLWTSAFKGRELMTQIKDLTLDSVFGAGVTARFHAAKTGEGRLYYTASLSYYQPASAEKAASNGYTVEKTIKPLEGSLDHLKAGTRAVVTLKFHTTREHNFVAVNDPLPGGFEIVDPSYAVEGKAQEKKLPNRIDDAWGWYWGNFNRNEKYDDRILIFADDLGAGDHTYSYLIQATTPGVFTIPSTWAESMYEPEVFGRTDAGSVTIEP